MRPSLAFLERYTGMQDAYFALLAETLGATPEELRELYNFYHAKEYVVFEGMEKSDLLNYIYGKTEFNKGMTVKEAYELYLREGLPDGVWEIDKKNQIGSFFVELLWKWRYNFTKWQSVCFGEGIENYDCYNNE